MNKKINTFIRKNSYLINGLSNLSAASLVGILCGLATAYAFANYLDKELFGQYQFILTLITLFSIFSLRGVQYSIIQGVRNKESNVLINNITKFIVYALPIAGVGLLISIYYFYSAGEALGISILIAAVTFPFFKGFSFYSTIFTARKEFKKQAIFDSIYSLIPTVFIILAIFTISNITQLVSIYLLSNIVVSGILLYIAIKMTRNEHVAQLVNQSPTKALHRSTNISIVEFEKMVHQLLIFNILGATALATYALAALPVREMTRIQKMLRILALPKITEIDKTKIKKILYSKTVSLFSIFSFISLLYVIAAPFVLPLLFPQYPESVLLTQIIIWMLPFSSIFLIYQALVFYSNEKKLYAINILTLTVRIILVSAGIIYSGLTGVAIGIVLAMFFRFLILLWAFKTEEF